MEARLRSASFSRILDRLHFFNQVCAVLLVVETLFFHVCVLNESHEPFEGWKQTSLQHASLKLVFFVVVAWMWNCAWVCCPFVLFCLLASLQYRCRFWLEAPCLIYSTYHMLRAARAKNGADVGLGPIEHGFREKIKCQFEGPSFFATLHASQVSNNNLTFSFNLYALLVSI